MIEHNDFEDDSYYLNSRIKKLEELLCRCHDVIWLNCLEPIEDFEKIPQEEISQLINDIMRNIET